MGTVLLVVLGLLAVTMTVGGGWALWDTYKPQPNLPMIFAWAKDANKVMGTIFGLLLLGGGIAIGAVTISNF